MRSPIENSRENRFQLQTRSRLSSTRKMHRRRTALEFLEPRILMAVLPPVTHAPQITNPVNISGGTKNTNMSAPTIAVDPLNSQKLVAAWVDLDPTDFGPNIQSLIKGAFSTNGGVSWQALNVPGNLPDPAATGPPYSVASNPSIAFDHQNHVYLLSQQASGTSGAFVLDTYNFGGGSPALTVNRSLANRFEGNAPATPVLVVDNGLDQFTDPTTGKVQADPFAGSTNIAGANVGNVYVAWSTNDPDLRSSTVDPNYNPNRIQIVASSNGGASFGPVEYVDSGGFTPGNQRYAVPSLTFSQGRAPGTFGLGDPGIQPGLVSVGFDDINSGNNATPPVDMLVANRIQPGASQGFTANFNPNNSGTIKDGTGTTSFPVNVQVDPRFTTLSDVSVTVNITHPTLTELQIQLQAPDGTTYTLMQTNDPAGGSDLGIDANGNPIGTTFSLGALISINAAGAAAAGAASPFLGNWLPDPTIAGDSPLSGLLGRTPAQLNGPWHLLVTDTVNDGVAPPPPPTQFLTNWTLHLTSGMSNGNNAAIGNTTVRQSTPIANSAMPQGILPGLVLASDNTLGSYSPNEGRLYAVYVDRYDPLLLGGGLTNNAFINNPADNTDIFLKVSDDGGLTWQDASTFAGIPVAVNDDSGPHDGFSEGTQLSDLIDFGGTVQYMTGRPQFEPEVAVDPLTGTLSISFLDTRFDASRARVATTIATSIDGGFTFGPETFANRPNSALDEITQQQTTLGPLPENQSAANTLTDPTFGFGPSQGLAALGGHIYTAWSANLNGGLLNGTKTQTLIIEAAPMVTAAGPRIISSTMGPVKPTTVFGTTFNNQFASDGTNEVNGFVVTFDRPIIASTFDTSSVLVQFLSPTGDPTKAVGTPGGPVSIPVNAVTPLDLFGPSGLPQIEATTFLVHFTSAQNAVGTYSYEIVASKIRDVFRTNSAVGNLMDQNLNGTPGQAGDFYATPMPINGATAFHAPYDLTTVPMIVTGPHVISTRAVLTNGSLAPIPTGQVDNPDNLVTDNTVSGLDVTFDRDMNAATFTRAQVLRIMGPTGLIPITNQVNVVVSPANADPNHIRTFRISFPTQQLSGTYTITLDSSIKSAAGTALDTNLNAGLDVLHGFSPNGPNVTISTSSLDTPKAILPLQTAVSNITVTSSFAIQGVTLSLNITSPLDTDLEASLVALDPGGNPANNIVIPLFTRVGSAGGQQGFSGTVFDDNANTPIQNGGRPFFGSFKPQQSLLTGLLNVNSARTFQLQIKNDSTTNTSTLTGWSLNLLKGVPGTGLGEPVADRAQASFRIFTMDPTNPLSSNTWTAVGPAAISASGGAGPESTTDSRSGRIGGLAVDPSDPSGNTVYVGGASGGIWKTTNFLTTDPQGPTYIPLTDFGPTFGINVGGIAVFGRNNDTNQSIIFAATGEGDTASPGVGLLRSLDGGATWALLDSSTNVDANGNALPINSPLRDHVFFGTTSFKIVVDPKPTKTGDVVAYAAISDPTGNGNGGIWRTIDTGKHWTKLLAGDASDVVLDPASGFFNAVSNPTSNLQIVYAAIRGVGVFQSQNEGLGWTQLLGNVGDPFFQDRSLFPITPVPIAGGTNGAPSGGGRIVLAKPFLGNNSSQNFLYEGWLYAAVVTPGPLGSVSGSLQGLYITKDFGRNWTKINLSNQVNGAIGGVQADPSNDPGLGTQVDPLGSANFGTQGNYDISLIVDPINPNVVYLGGTADGNSTGLIRVDTTGISDPYSFYLGANGDGSFIRADSTDPIGISNPQQNPTGTLLFPNPFTEFDVRVVPTINMVRDPFNPFSNSTFYTNNATTFTNSGTNIRWIPFDDAVSGSTDQHRVIAYVDPLTGLSRLIFGDDQGVYSDLVAKDGSVIGGLGLGDDFGEPDIAVPSGSRNGNLQITQFYYGAAQASNIAAQIATLQGMFYGNAQDDGFPRSDPNVIQPGQAGYGNITWAGPGGDGGGVAVDQNDHRNQNPAQTTGDVFQYKWPCCGGNITDFFQVNEIGQSTGLASNVNPPGSQVPDPQWPFTGVLNFAINPIDADQVVISSNDGRIFRTETRGQVWIPIAEPGVDIGSGRALALAYGAPDPNPPGGSSTLDNFIYVGADNGQIFVTFKGGGSGNWTNLSAGLDGSPVEAIVTNPTRGSHEAYAITQSGGVFHMVDSSAGSPSWLKINGPTSGNGTPLAGNLLALTHNPFGNVALNEVEAKGALTSIQADWRYLIPNNFSNPTGPTHPLLYAGGEAGVYRSLDGGQTWSLFPDSGPGSLLNSPYPNGGGLPIAHVTDLDLSLGFINPTTGTPDESTGSNVLLATTFGRGSFAIRLAPIVFPTSVALDPNLPAPGGSIGQGGVVTVTQPVIDGLSEQSAFGNTVTINLIDQTPTDATFGQIIGTGSTDANGDFAVQINAGVFKSDGSTDGSKTIGVQAINASGTKGNIVTFTFFLQAGPQRTTIGLLPADDSGTKGDNITTVRQPHLIGVTVPNLFVDLIDTNGDVAGVAGAVLATVTADNQGNYTIQFPSPLPGGTFHVQTRGRDSSGNTVISQVLALQILTAPPSVAPTIGLLPSDDSGTKGDSITNITQPHLFGVTDPGLFIDLIDTNGDVAGVAGAVLATATANPVTGAYLIQFTGPLADGIYHVQARARDTAGDTALSAVLTLQIDTIAPSLVPTLGISPADDTGVKGDGVTVVRRPHLVGTAVPGGLVQIIQDHVIPDNGTPLTSSITTLFDGGLFVIANLAVQLNIISPRDSDLTVVLIDPNGVPHTLFSGVGGNGQNFTGTTLDDGAAKAINDASAVAPFTGSFQTPTKVLAALNGMAIQGIWKLQITDNKPGPGGVALLNSWALIATPTSGPPQTFKSAVTVLASTIADVNGNFSTQLSSDLNNGTIGLQSQSADVAGNLGPLSAPFALTVTTVQGDYDGDGKADLPLFRGGTAAWFVLESTAGGVAAPVTGSPGDLPLQGDFNGDGKTDQVTYNFASALWSIRSARGLQTIQFGQPGVDIPVPGDYDGDGVTDLAVYRPTTNTWLILRSTNGPLVQTFGQAGDIPAPAAYDGGLTTEVAVYRPSTAQFLILGTDGTTRTVKVGTPNAATVNGLPGEVPISTDFSGDGKADPAVYEPATATWRYISSSANTEVDKTLGAPKTDIPVPRDYDGDGKADYALFRPKSTPPTGAGAWLIVNSAGGTRNQSFGASTDTPVSEPLAYLLLGKTTFGKVAAQSHSLALGTPASSSALVTIPAGSAISTPKVASSSSTTKSVSLTSQSAPINVVVQSLQPATDVLSNASKAASSSDQQDLNLAAALVSLGSVKSGRFLPDLGA